MKTKFKALAVGTVIVALSFSLLFIFSANHKQKNITALRNEIRIYNNGKPVQPKDTKGNAVVPLLYDDTTYIPLNTFSEILGKEMRYERDINSVYIAEKTNKSITTVTVSTVKEFLKAISSYKRIVLKPGIYDLSSSNHMDSPDKTVTWKNVLDGKELNIQNITNLTIEGTEKGKIEIIVSPRYANIISFKDVHNITIKNIVAGHAPKGYDCDAGVLSFTDSSNISISNTKLYGCGSIGLELYRVNKLDFNDSTITECSLSALDINSSKYIEFKRCNFTKHRTITSIFIVSASNFITFEECSMLDNHKWPCYFLTAHKTPVMIFDKCTFANNSRYLKYRKYDSCLFYTDNSNIFIKDSIIKNNNCDYLAKNDSDVVLKNCTIENNTMIK